MCHDKRNGGKLHENISWNGYGNAIIGRYGGCFEEDIRRFMCDRVLRLELALVFPEEERVMQQV